MQSFFVEKNYLCCGNTSGVQGPIETALFVGGTTDAASFIHTHACAAQKLEKPVNINKYSNKSINKIVSKSITKWEIEKTMKKEREEKKHDKHKTTKKNNKNNNNKNEKKNNQIPWVNLAAPRAHVERGTRPPTAARP